MPDVPKPPKPKVKPKKMGRPTTYTESLATLICTRLAQGESMRKVSRDPTMPSMNTLFRWLVKYENFSQQYAQAKQESADAMYEELLDITDDGRNDYMEALGKDGVPVGYKLNGEHIQRSKLRVDTRKWMMSKMKPKKYGDKQIVEQTIDHGFTTTDIEKLQQKLIDKGIDPSSL